MLFFIVFFCLGSAVENLQNLLFTRIEDQNPNDEKKMREEQLGTAEDFAEAEENHVASARKCKSHSMAIGGAKELTFRIYLAHFSFSSSSFVFHDSDILPSSPSFCESAIFMSLQTGKLHFKSVLKVFFS